MRWCPSKVKAVFFQLDTTLCMRVNPHSTNEIMRSSTWNPCRLIDHCAKKWIGLCSEEWDIYAAAAASHKKPRGGKMMLSPRLVYALRSQDQNNFWWQFFMGREGRAFLISLGPFMSHTRVLWRNTLKIQQIPTHDNHIPLCLGMQSLAGGETKIPSPILHNYYAKMQH